MGEAKNIYFTCLKPAAKTYFLKVKRYTNNIKHAEKRNTHRISRRHVSRSSRRINGL